LEKTKSGVASSRSHSNSTSSSPGIFNACPNPNLALCNAGGSSNHTKTNNKKKGDVVTISFAPGDHVTASTPADGGHDKDGDDDHGDDESSEQTVTNVLVPAVDNDELLVTVTDITSQAQ